MRDPAVKAALVLCVLLGGFCAAMLFRNDRTRQAAPAPGAEDDLVLRFRGAPPAVQRPANGQPSAGSAPAPIQTLPDAGPATIVMPSSRREPPPSLSSDNLSTERPASARWGQSMEMMLPVAKPVDDAGRTHTVVDGDQLETLAERYLGSSARADEIYRLNRNVIDNPRVLPIGVELKLPPRNR